MKNEGKILVGVCALVIGVYACMAHSGPLELQTSDAADTYYNLLVRGFRAGQISLKKEAPPGFIQLADPYNPTANAPYRAAPYNLHDLSYYKGKLYLYFGVTPALLLFWPFVALTGRYLFHREAVAIFCAIGFLASVGLLRAVWRHYFSEVSIWVVAACAFALGLATGVPMLLSRAEVYEVAISSGYMLTMLTLWVIWHALQEPERRCRWLATASLAYGLAVGARPSLLFGAVILLMPVAQAWREQRRIWTPLMAAIVPITLVGLGLMLYNDRRFGSPFEFGQRYQLVTGSHLASVKSFSLDYLYFNLRVYFLKSVGWSRHFPFVQKMRVPPLPPGHGGVEGPFGIFANIPLAWLALAAPLAWRSRSAGAVSGLRWFVSTVALLFGITAITIGLFYYTCARYEVEFLPALLLLAVFGVLGLEYALADRPVWKRAARCLWGLLLSLSVAFNLLVIIGYYAETHYNAGFVLANEGRMAEAIEQFEQAIWFAPGYDAAHVDLGNALLHMGKVKEAIAQYELALRIDPDYVEAHLNLGLALVRLGSTDDAIRHDEEALRLRPDSAEGHMNLGNALLTQGKLQDATAHYEEALRIKPDYPLAHDNLGVALAQTGRISEAVEQFKQALRLKPDDVEAHFDLGLILENMGRTPEAIEHYQQALKLRPDYLPATKALARLLAGP